MPRTNPANEHDRTTIPIFLQTWHGVCPRLTRRVPSPLPASELYPLERPCDGPGLWGLWTNCPSCSRPRPIPTATLRAPGTRGVITPGDWLNCGLLLQPIDQFKHIKCHTCNEQFFFRKIRTKIKLSKYSNNYINMLIQKQHQLVLVVINGHTSIVRTFAK